MPANEHTALLRPHQNGENGWLKIKPDKTNGKLIIHMPKDPVFDFEYFSAALSLEELLPYQDDPWWQKLRSTIFYSFWFVMILTSFTACVVAYMHGGSYCKALNSTISSSNLDLTTSTLATTSLIDNISGKLTVLST